MDKKLSEALESLLSEFLDFQETNVDTGEPVPSSYNSPEEMKETFEDWIAELVSEFTFPLDWEEMKQEQNS